MRTDRLDGDRLHEGCVARISGAIAGRRLEFDVEITHATERCLALVADGPISIEAQYLLSPDQQARARTATRARSLSDD